MSCGINLLLGRKSCSSNFYRVEVGRWCRAQTVPIEPKEIIL